MKKFRAQVDKNGRIVIPSSIRKDLNYKHKDIVVIETDKDSIRITKMRDVIKQAQKLVQSHTKGKSLVDEFLLSRREEYELENKKFERNKQK